MIDSHDKRKKHTNTTVIQHQTHIKVISSIKNIKFDQEIEFSDKEVDY